MIDCTKTENYLKEKARMVGADDIFCAIDCRACPLSQNNNIKKADCQKFEFSFPEEAVAAVQKWSDEHPIKTYKDDFLEKFPKADKATEGHPDFCLNRIYGFSFACKADCAKCWNETYNEERGGKK